jgi:hypothetical protein
LDINILFAVTIAFAKDHKEDGIIFVPVHPGMVETQMLDEAKAVRGEHNGVKSITTEESAKKQLEVLFPSFTFSISLSFSSPMYLPFLSSCTTDSR